PRGGALTGAQRPPRRLGRRVRRRLLGRAHQPAADHRAPGRGLHRARRRAHRPGRRGGLPPPRAHRGRRAPPAHRARLDRGRARRGRLHGVVTAPNDTRTSYDTAQQRSDRLWSTFGYHRSGLAMLTGDRPTGSLHIGHYFGSLRNRVRLQDAGVETWLIVADYQVITDREVIGDIKGSVRELLTDYLAVGIDPERSTIFTHSSVPALNQLMLPFLSLVTQP